MPHENEKNSEIHGIEPEGSRCAWIADLGSDRLTKNTRRQAREYRLSQLMAEREGFEPPIGLHLCRISSAVHSTTLPPLLKAPSKEQGPCGSGVNRRGWRARQGLRGRKSAACFGPARPFPARTRGKGGPITGLTRFCRARGGVRFATPMRRHPLPGPPASAFARRRASARQARGRERTTGWGGH